MLKSAACASCDHALPLGPSWRALRLAPYEMTCPGCGKRFETIFMWRVGWMEHLLHRVCLLASLPVGVALGLLRTDWPVHVRALVALLALPVGGGLGGLVLSRVLGLPTQVLRDRIERRRRGA